MRKGTQSPYIGAGRTNDPEKILNPQFVSGCMGYGHNFFLSTTHKSYCKMKHKRKVQKRI